MSGRLHGKVAVVTGAASSAPGVGIGAAISILLAREGARVIVVNRSLAHAASLAEEITGEGGHCSAVAADVTTSEGAAAAIDAAGSRYGALHVLVNNVGSGGPGTVVDATEQLWEQTMATNLRSVFLCCKHAVPHMIEAGGGSIVNVSSVAALQGFRRGGSGFAPYSAAKAGVIGLTRAVAADHARENVRSNCLIVGMAHTPRMEKFGQEHRRTRTMAVPLQREGTAWDAAWAAVFLASEESRWITGACLPVDGGQLSLREWPE
ncbi:MAG TPA: SDR family NAD(P)-dependent oxidoreductase [Candidatus Limnocylindrales bacterium]|nr:SDR family NAD(P)-dependent oxidoreductase [Candidatus Limnocylindrales bacterium]